MNWFMRSETVVDTGATEQASAVGTFPKWLPSAIVALVILGAAAGSGVAVSKNGPAAGPTSGSGSATSGASADRASALGLSSNRSPGVRGDATLNKTKLARADQPKSSTEKRRSRLIPRGSDARLPAAATPLVLPFDMAALTLPTEQLQRGMAAVGSGDLMPVALTGSPGTGGGSAVVALPATTGGGSGGTGAVPGGDVAPVATPAPQATGTPAPVPEVPEPSVWLTMLIGFGLTGAVLRNTRARRNGFALGKSVGA